MSGLIQLHTYRIHISFLRFHSWRKSWLSLHWHVPSNRIKLEVACPYSMPESQMYGGEGAEKPRLPIPAVLAILFIMFSKAFFFSPWCGARLDRITAPSLRSPRYCSRYSSTRSEKNTILSFCPFPQHFHAAHSKIYIFHFHAHNFWYTTTGSQKTVPAPYYRGYWLRRQFSSSPFPWVSTLLGSPPHIWSDPQWPWDSFVCNPVRVRT